MSAPPPDDPDSHPERGDLDFDAEFERIVAGWGPPSVTPGQTDEPGESPTGTDETGETGRTAAAPGSSQGGPVAGDDSLRSLFRGAWPDDESAGGRDRDDEPHDPEEHFVPPPAPPIPRPEPRRLLAWSGLLGGPLVGLLWLVLGTLPSSASFLLFCWFVGGFGYLVATMKDGGSDGWDDGARV